MKDLPDQFWELIACPYCGTPLPSAESGLECPSCAESYPRNANGQLDLRLRRQKTYTLDISLPGGLSVEAFDFSLFGPNPAPAFTNVQLTDHRLYWGNRLTPELISYLPKADGPGQVMLDMGCGDASFREFMGMTGFAYVGMDYSDPAAPILGDAHGLPFRDESFDFVIAMGVLEHIRYPLVAVKEVSRVLKPGGRFIGTLSFLEPFHDNSYYHSTLLGTLNLLLYGGFKVEHLAPHPTWSGIVAQTKMTLLHRMPGWLSALFALPLQVSHRLWWKLAERVRPGFDTSENSRRLRTTGGFGFSAVKPA